MTLRACRRIQTQWHGGLLVAALVLVFVSASGLANACATLAGAETASTAHCGECPDKNPGPDDSCSGASLCAFAGSAFIEVATAFVPAIAAPAARIDIESPTSASIFLIPPNPPPIRG